MRFKHLYELAELYTLPVNFFIYLIGFSFIHFKFNSHLSLPLIVGLITISLFHSLVNIHNNYMDYQNATDDNYKTKTNVIGRENLQLHTIKWLMIILFLTYIACGVYLVSYGGWPLAIIGFLGTTIGFAYSSGPYPINSTIFAETITSISMGILIPLTAIYIGLTNQVPFTFDIFFQSLMVCLPIGLISFSLLLANNTCDLKEDINNKSFTLVFYLGQKKAVHIFRVIYFSLPVLIITLFILKLIPPLTLLSLIIFPFTFPMIQNYLNQQSKNKTFPFALKGLSLIILSYSIAFFLGAYY